MFIERTRMGNELPFPAVNPQNRIMTRNEARQVLDDLRDEASDMPDMPLEEINAEIAAVRQERKNRQ